MNVEATRRREAVGIQTALFAPVLPLGNLCVVGGPWGPVWFVALLCLAVGLGIVWTAEVSDEEDGSPAPTVDVGDERVEEVMSELRKLRITNDIVQAKNDKLVRELSRTADEPEEYLGPDEAVVHAFGLPTTVLGCTTCSAKGCAACARHAWVAAREQQGWPEL